MAASLRRGWRGGRGRRLKMNAMAGQDRSGVVRDWRRESRKLNCAPDGGSSHTGIWKRWSSCLVSSSLRDIERTQYARSFTFDRLRFAKGLWHHRISGKEYPLPSFSRRNGRRDPQGTLLAGRGARLTSGWSWMRLRSLHPRSLPPFIGSIRARCGEQGDSGTAH